MAELIEIIVVARDLASGTIDKAARKLESNLSGMRVEAAKTSAGFNSLSRSTEDFASHSERVAARTQQISRELEAAERALTGLGGATQDAANELDHHVASLRREQAELRNTEQRVGGFTGSLGRLGRAIRETITAHVGLGRAQSDNARGFSLFSTAARDAERDAGRLSRGLGALERAGANVGRAITNFASGVFSADKKLKSFDSRSRQLGNGFGLMLRSLTSVNIMFIAILGGLSLLPGALAGVAGGVVALTGGITALVAALSSMSALVVAIPAAFAGLAGIIGAVVSILKPATSGILDFVKASDKAKKLGAGTTGGGASGAGSTQQAVQQAQQNLQSTKQVNAIQEQKLESELAQARIDAVNRVRDAERNLAQTRESVYRRLIDLERQLVTLRADNDQQRAELEKSVASAEQRAREEAAKPGGGRSVLAQALVGEAHADLAKFNRDAASSEGDLISQIVQEREQGIAQIKKAEEDLIQTRADGVRHIRDLELSLRQTRIQNAQQERAAAQAVQQARTGSPGGASAATDLATAAFNRLSPIQKTIANQILAIKDRWKQLTEVFRNRFLGEVSKDLTLISKNLPVIASRVGLFADVITRSIGRARRAFNDKTFTKALDVGVKDAARNTEQFGKVIINLGKAVTIVTAAAKPFLDWITDSVVAWSKYVEVSAKVNAQNGGLATFFAHARETISTVVDIVKNLGVGLFNIGKIGRDTGQSFLETIDKMAKRFRAFTDSTSGKNKIKAFFDDVRPVLNHVFHDIGKVIGVLAHLGRNSIKGGEKSPFIKVLKAVEGVVSDIADGIKNLGKNLGPDVLKTVQDLAGAFKDLSGHTNALKIVIGVVDVLIRGTRALSGDKNPISDALASIIAATGVLVLAFPKLGEVFATKVALPILGWIAGMIAGLIGFDIVVVDSTVLMTIFGATVDFALAPILLILLAIAALVFVLTHWDETKRAVRHFVEFLGKAWDWVKKEVSAAWDWIKKEIPKAWHAIVDWVKHDAPGLLLDALNFIWDALKKDASDAWGELKHLASEGWHGLVRFFTSTAPGLLKRAFSAIWDGISSLTSDAIGGIVSEIKGFVNHLIDAANWVLHHIGISSTIPNWHDAVAPPSQSAQHGGRPQPAATGWIGNEAVGNIVPATPGGLLHIVEAGHPEAVLSLDPKHKNRTLAIIAEVLKRLGIRDPKPNLFEAIARARAVAADLLPDAAIFATPMAGGGIGGGTIGKNTPLGKSIEALREATRIDKLDLSYLWGGGHSTTAPDDGPFDCSSFVSHILQHVGLLGGTEVSGDLARYGSPGLSPGIGVLANSGHVYMEMLGQYFGTSSNNPGGGPGKLTYGIRDGFALRRPNDFPTTKKDLLGDFKFPDGGQSFLSSIGDAVASGAGAFASIGGTIYDSIASVVDWIESKLPHFPHLPGLFGEIPGAAFDYVRDKVVDYAKDKVPFFDRGGTVPGPTGKAVPIIAHAGEWILNREQQLRLARAIGGWAKARDLLFSTQQPVFSTSFAGGGIVGATTTTTSARTANLQVGPIYTTSPTIDIDYIGAVLDRRLGEMG